MNYYQAPLTNFLTDRDRREIRRRCSLAFGAWAGMLGLFVGLTIVHCAAFLSAPTDLDWRFCFCGGMAAASAGMVFHYSRRLI